MTLAWRVVRTLALDPAAHPRGAPHLAAGSGLVRIGNLLHVVADDEHHLATFDLDREGHGRLFRLVDGDLPASPKKRKKEKRDLEVLLRLPDSPRYPSGALLALGSGSRDRRKVAAVVALDASGMPAGDPSLLDATPIHDGVAAAFVDPNIEGGFIVGDSLVLLQRGNKGSVNASIRFDLAGFVQWAEGGPATAIAGHAIQRYDLGDIDGVPLCFTDGAALADGRWVFCAVAERTDDSYADGAFVGSAVGFVDGGGTVERIEQVGAEWKIEGVAAKVDADRLTLLCVTDADDPDAASVLLEATERG